MASNPSAFHGFTDVGDDTTLEVKGDKDGPRPINVAFWLPGYRRMPDLYLSLAKARELRDQLAAVLADVESVAS